MKFLEDLAKHVSEKLTNPFFATLVVVWTYKHWILVYSLFYFTTDFTLKDRLHFIATYVDQRSLNDLILFPIYWSFLAVVIFSLGKNATLGITIIFKRWVRPFMYYWLDRSNTIDKDQYKDLRRQFDEQVQELDSEREEKRKLVDQAKAAKESEAKQATDFFELEKAFLTYKSENQNVKMRTEIGNVMEGLWVNVHSVNDNINDEQVQIEQGNNYLSNGDYIFDLDMVDIVYKDTIPDTVKFRKIGKGEDVRYAHNDLSYDDKGKFLYGIEQSLDGNNALMYFKTGDDKGAEVLFFPFFNEPIIRNSDHSALNFWFRSHSARKINLKSYRIFGFLNGEKIFSAPKHPYDKQIVSGTPWHEPFGKVNPLMDYFKNSNQNGHYELLVEIEYQYEGRREMKKLHGRAKLVVR